MKSDSVEYKDPSGGYEAVADEFIRSRDRSGIGASTVRRWAEALPSGAAILDLGCGHGAPISETLINDGYTVYGVDASPRLVEEFHQRFPGVPVVCEAIETSRLFDRKFDGVIAIGLLFLLTADAQEALVRRIAEIVPVGGRLLVTAPVQTDTWHDILTGRLSISLGEEEYRRILSEAGFTIEEQYLDEGDNHYFSCVRDNLS